MEELLRTLMSHDNGLRGQAEQAFNEACGSQYAEVVTSLVQLLGAHPDPVIRTFAAVLLRRQLSFANQVEDWQNLGEDIREGGTCVMRSVLGLGCCCGLVCVRACV